ncbi:hypothetical protein [Paenibacillus sp. CF384]|uniref:hypothetical protein n=1 Tax=Paenibacillus sp. CF384 TaxID=1884382 RepID=UPI0008982E37|nr:hypothetical protein [Paenibacillus sp. CF384]SDW68258.1 hypothetical protein SAMN05518855_1004126 [Paenibacillus sp. CF384]
MVSPWMTNVVILFGIIVAIVGVVAYLRVYKNSAWSAASSSNSRRTDQPSDNLMPSAEESAATIDQPVEDDKI